MPDPVEITGSVAERLRAFLCAHDVGEDQVLMTEVYSPLFHFLEKAGILGTCPEQDFDHCFRATVREEQEKRAEFLRDRVRFYACDQYALIREKRRLRKQNEELRERLNRQAESLRRENAELQSKTNALSALVDDKQETLEAIREEADELRGARNEYMHLNSVLRDRFNRQFDTIKKLQDDRPQLLDEIQRLSDALETDKVLSSGLIESLRDRLDEANETLEALREVFRNPRVLDILRKSGSIFATLLRLKMKERGLADYGVWADWEATF